MAGRSTWPATNSSSPPADGPAPTVRPGDHTEPTTPNRPHRADYTSENRAVHPASYWAVMASWGRCDRCPADLNADGIVDAHDLLEALDALGPDS